MIQFEDRFWHRNGKQEIIFIFKQARSKGVSVVKSPLAFRLLYSSKNGTVTVCVCVCGGGVLKLSNILSHSLFLKVHYELFLHSHNFTFTFIFCQIIIS